MSWQADIFARLRDREWHHLGELFEMVQERIPLHTAMRHAMLRRKPDDFPANGTARWELFLQTLRIIQVESDGDPKHRRYTDRVRLKYVAGKSCAACAGPVIKTGWASHDHVTCLACTAPPVQVPPPVYREKPMPEYRARRILARMLKLTMPGWSVTRIERHLSKRHP